MKRLILIISLLWPIGLMAQNHAAKPMDFDAIYAKYSGKSGIKYVEITKAMLQQLGMSLEKTDVLSVLQEIQAIRIVEGKQSVTSFTEDLKRLTIEPDDQTLMATANDNGQITRFYFREGSSHGRHSNPAKFLIVSYGQNINAAIYITGNLDIKTISTLSAIQELGDLKKLEK